MSYSGDMAMIGDILGTELGLTVRHNDGGMGGDWFEWTYAGLTHVAGHNGETWAIALYNGDPADDWGGAESNYVATIETDLNSGITEPAEVGPALVQAIAQALTARR